MKNFSIHQPLCGDTITSAGMTTTFKLRSAATDGRYSLTEFTLPPRFPGQPSHIHRVFEHTFYVLEGTVHVQLCDQVIQAGVGTSVFIPTGVVHTFSNPNPQPASMLAIDTPGGLERFYEELAVAFPPGTPLRDESLREILARYDTFPAVSQSAAA